MVSGICPVNEADPRVVDPPVSATLADVALVLVRLALALHGLGARPRSISVWSALAGEEAALAQSSLQ